jgi:hypothetical protein
MIYIRDSKIICSPEGGILSGEDDYSAWAADGRTMTLVVSGVEDVCMSVPGYPSYLSDVSSEINNTVTLSWVTSRWQYIKDLSSSGYTVTRYSGVGCTGTQTVADIVSVTYQLFQMGSVGWTVYISINTNGFANFEMFRSISCNNICPLLANNLNNIGYTYNLTGTSGIAYLTLDAAV